MNGKKHDAVKNSGKNKKTKTSNKPKTDSKITGKISKSDKNNKVKKVVVVHGWDADINKEWFPWLRSTLESHGFKVIMEQMPNPSFPKIEEWIAALKNHCGIIDEQTYFVGHSIGCQTIIRMLEKTDPISVTKAGGAIFLAGWFKLKEETFKENPENEEKTRMIAGPWLEENINFEIVQTRLPEGKIVAIFSDNDPYVDIVNAEIFKQKFGARILIESGKGHYTGNENVKTIPIIIEELLRITREDKDN